MLAHLGAMLASWGYVGPCWGYVGLSWGQCGPILGLCWPSSGLSWPILGAMLPHVGAMLIHLEAYVGPCWPILSHKSRKSAKNGKSTKHRKTRGFLAGGRGRRQGARPLSPTERRETPFGNATARGPLAGLRGYAPCRRPLEQEGQLHRLQPLVVKPLKPAADGFGGRFRNGKTPWYAGPNGASEAPVPVPNVAFWARSTASTA